LPEDRPEPDRRYEGLTTGPLVKAMTPRPAAAGCLGLQPGDAARKVRSMAAPSARMLRIAHDSSLKGTFLVPPGGARSSEQDWGAP
jgi:hypothetical protein